MITASSSRLLVKGIVHTVENYDNNDVHDHEEQEGWQGGEPVRYLVAHVDINLVGSVDPICQGCRRFLTISDPR